MAESSRKLLRIKVTPDLHLTYSKTGGNLGFPLDSADKSPLPCHILHSNARSDSFILNLNALKGRNRRQVDRSTGQHVDRSTGRRVDRSTCRQVDK